MWISYTLDPASQYLINLGIPLPKCDAELDFYLEFKDTLSRPRFDFPYMAASHLDSWVNQYLFEWRTDKILRKVQAMGIWASIVLLRRWNPNLPEWLTDDERETIWDGAEQFLAGALSDVPYNDFIAEDYMEDYYMAIEDLEDEINNADSSWYRTFLRNLKNVFRYWVAVLKKEDQPYDIQPHSRFTVTSAARAYGIGIFLMTHPNVEETTHSESIWYIFKYACNFMHAWADYAQKLMIGM